MSWIFASLGKLPEQLEERISKILPDPISEFRHNNFKSFSGGNPDTHFYGNTTSDDKYFVTVGVPIIYGSEQPELMTNDDWKNLHINSAIDKDCQLDGHYAGIYYDNGIITFFTDQIGIRSLHTIHYEGVMLISTRADWLACVAGRGIDFSEFSTRWIFFNGISTKSIFKGISRHHSGEYGTIADGKVRVKQNSLQFEKRDDRNAAGLLALRLEKLIRMGIDHKRKMSLSFSGGLDSRVLLSFLLDHQDGGWNTHTFEGGSSADADVTRKISKELNFENIRFKTEGNENYPINTLTEYAAASQASESVLTFPNLSYYNSLGHSGFLIIDGGFGEILRREFFMKLFLKGEKILREENLSKAAAVLRIPRADIFSEEITDEMEQKLQPALKNLISELPPADEIGFENWIDLFAVRTRLPNYYSMEQSRIDSLVQSYMPFAQKSVLSLIPGIPVSLRRNGGLFKQFIKSKRPDLAGFNLAKGDVTIPFGFGSFSGRAAAALKRKFGMVYKQTTEDRLLYTAEEFIYDSFSSKELVESGIYEKSKVDRIINGYFSGQNKFRQSLGWLLTFELFRQGSSRRI